MPRFKEKVIDFFDAYCFQIDKGTKQAQNIPITVLAWTCFTKKVYLLRSIGIPLFQNLE